MVASIVLGTMPSGRPSPSPNTCVTKSTSRPWSASWMRPSRRPWPRRASASGYEVGTNDDKGRNVQRTMRPQAASVTARPAPASFTRPRRCGPPGSHRGPGCVLGGRRRGSDERLRSRLVRHGRSSARLASSSRADRMVARLHGLGLRCGGVSAARERERYRRRTPAGRTHRARLVQRLEQPRSSSTLSPRWQRSSRQAGFRTARWDGSPSSPSGRPSSSASPWRSRQR